MTQRRSIIWLAVLLVAVTNFAAIVPQTYAQDGSGASDQITDTILYVWEEYGISFDMPSTWQVIGRNQDFDLAIVSPEAFASGSGSFITWSHVGSLGTDTPESALQSIADQVGGEVQPFTIAGGDGAAVITETKQPAADGEEATAVTQYLLLAPYGDGGESFYLQAVAADGDAETMESIFNSIAMDPPKPDYAAIDSAWQQSLADDGVLAYGASDAPISMVELMSFTCGHCVNYSFDIGRLMALEAEPGNIRLQIGMIASAEQESVYAPTLSTYCAAEQGKGYSAYTAIMQGYLTDGAGAYTFDGTRAILSSEQFALDMDQYDTCIADQTYASQIQDVRTLANEVGLTGTPSVLFSTEEEELQFLLLPTGETWSGIIPLSTLRMVIEQIIETDTPIADILSAPEMSANPSDPENATADQNISNQRSSDPASQSENATNNDASPVESVEDNAANDNGSDINPILVIVGLSTTIVVGAALVFASRRTPKNDQTE